MNEIFNFLKQFFNKFQLWIMVSPWQQAIRVRLGKHVKLLGAGVHFKIPFADSFYIQTTRLRTTSLNKITVTNAGGQMITFSASIGYAIADVLKLYQTLHHAEDYIASVGRTAIAEYISTHATSECSPLQIQESIKLDLEKYGLSEVNLFLGDFAVVRTYRLIGDYGTYGSGGNLDTSKSTTEVSPGTPS